jgi:hypothetical protein
MLFYTDRDYDDDIRDELRAEAAAERRRLRPHWCEDCRGFSGGPCDFGEPEEQDEEQEDSDE